MHTPPWQASPLVQAGVVWVKVPAWPRSRVVAVGDVAGRLGVRLQVGVLPVPGVRVRAVPPPGPPLVQVSLKVQVLPSSHAAPVLGVTVQLDVPLQVRVLHWSEVQVIAVPTHWPLPSQVSLKEQASPSSQLVPVSGVTVQLDVPLQVRVLHGSEVQVAAVPAQWPPPPPGAVQEHASPASPAAAQVGGTA